MVDFNNSAYLKNKAKQLNNKKEDGKSDWTTSDVKKAFDEAGLSPKEHYNRYGKDEGVSPEVDINEKAYITNKTNQLNRIREHGSDNWTVSKTKEAIDDAGLSIREHYNRYGKDEGISPEGVDHYGIEKNDSFVFEFDPNTYLKNKSYQLNDTFQNSRSDWDVSSTRDAIEDSGLSLVEHYNKYGKDEGVSPYKKAEQDVSFYAGGLGVKNRSVPDTEITPKQTVQGQLAQILDGDSPLMQRVGNKAKQAANSRGLLNSSMAEQAAQGAMIDQAAGIASQDAQTFFQNNQANADRDMTDYMQRLGFEQSLAQTAQEYDLRADMLAQEGDQAMEKLYGTSLANAWGVMGNNVTDIVAQTMQNVQAIQNNPNINAEDKTRMIQDALDMRDQDVQFQAELYSTLPDTLDDIGVFPERVT